MRIAPPPPSSNALIINSSQLSFRAPAPAALTAVTAYGAFRLASSCTRTLLRTVHRGGFTEILSDGFFLVSFIKLFFFIGSAGELTRTAHPPRP